MYFGFLFQVFQPVTVSFDPNDFPRLGNDGKREIATARLADYVLQWYRREGESPSNNAEQDLMH
jgi:hypothetical protein